MVNHDVKTEGENCQELYLENEYMWEPQNRLNTPVQDLLLGEALGLSVPILWQADTGNIETKKLNFASRKTKQHGA